MRLLTALFILIALGPAAFAQSDTAAVEDRFRAAFADACTLDEETSAAEYYPTQSWPLRWQEDYADTETEATLYQFFCFAGAYNVSLVYFLDDPFYGPIPVSFSVPQFDVTYEDEDIDGAVEDIRVRGFTAQSMLTNPEFDPDTGTMTNHALWRGIGDAASSGIWVFEKGQFVLKSFDVDASYDGQINPESIVQYK